MGMDGWTDGRMDIIQTEGRMDRWTDGRMDGWMNELVDGQIGRCIGRYTDG